MEVDVDIYRCSVGPCVASVILMPFITSFSKLAKAIGCVTFIRTLLIMAGIESNPGPDKLIFRYEYLLIEVGTQMMRKLFDHLTGNDFVQYLNAKPKQNTQLQKLINNRILTAEQTQVLPPIDNKPNTSNFDITLLACLLRNVCGLSNPKHSVWKTPKPGDPLLETDITRFRLCRNSLQHMSRVTVTDSEFQSKWNELVSILYGLNAVCGLTNLTSLIHDAEHMDTDDELKKQLDKTLKEWTDKDLLFDRGIEELKLGQSQIRQDLSDLKDGQREGKEVQCEIKDDLRRLDERKLFYLNFINVKECLKKTYLETCDRLQVSPLFNEDDEMDLLTIYQPPDMCHLPYHRDRQTEGEYSISSYQDIFTKDGKSFRNIYITGDAGVGKSSFCQRMALLWSKSQSGHITDNEDVQRDIDFMRTFDFVFYVSLRDTRQIDIVEMIIDTFFYTNSKVKREELITLIEDIIRVKRCLIILDGFDEWTPTTSGNETCRLPRKIKSETCTYITSCRPYKIENVRLDMKDMDRQIQMSGICEKSTDKYVEKIVNYVNKVNNSNKKSSDFLSEVKACALGDQLCIPIIASQLVMLWFDKGLTDMSRALLYGNVIEMMLERAVKDKKIKSTSSTVQIQLPERFTELSYLQMHASLLEKICSLSFRSLFQLDKSATALVFTEKHLMSYFITYEEINTLCKLGILSKNKSIANCARQELKISFIHKSYMEFLAALFVHSFDRKQSFDTIVNTWNSVVDIVQYKNFFIFLTGISYEKVQCLLGKFVSEISDEFDGFGTNYLTFFYGKVKLYQNFVLSCFKEVCRSKTPNVVLKLKHFWFDRDVDNSLLFDILFLNRTHVKSIRMDAEISKICSDNDMFNCTEHSQLELHFIRGTFREMSVYKAMAKFAYAVKTLQFMKFIKLYHMNLPDDVLLQLHPDIRQVNVELQHVIMSCKSFNCFIDSCVNNNNGVKVQFNGCMIRSVDGKTPSELSEEESVKYMNEYVKSRSTKFHIKTFKLSRYFYFETTSCQ